MTFFLLTAFVVVVLSLTAVAGVMLARSIENDLVAAMAVSDKIPNQASICLQSARKLHTISPSGADHARPVKVRVLRETVACSCDPFANPN